jgi:hypothetical protein
MYVVGEYREQSSVVGVLRALRAAGVDPNDLDLFSEEPVELPRGVLDRRSSMSMVSLSGAIAFGLAATAFIYFCQYNYRLVTGGMPVFSMWATGVITYEMTMLGSVVATFAWFLWESGLIRRHEAPATIPELAPGSIFVRVRCVSDRAAAVQETLRAAGAVALEKKGAV